MKILFYKGRARVANRLISWLMAGPYSHCEVVTEEHKDGSYTCWGSSYMDGGVREKRMVLHPDNWDTLEVAFDLAKAATWLEEQRGVGYDTVALAGFVYRPIKGNPDKWFCSELVAALLGIQDAWRYDPNTLASALTLIRADKTIQG